MNIAKTKTLTTDLQRFQSTSFPELIEDFLATKKSSQTKKAYRTDILTFFNKIWITDVGELATLPVHNLSKLIINYIESHKKSEEHRQDRLHNPRTLNRKAYALSSFFEYLVANYWYPRNPVKVYTPYSTPDRTSTDDLEKHEVEALWKSIKTAYETAKTPYKTITTLQKLLIFGFLMLSLRRNEIAHLRWDDRNRQKNFITVFWKWQKYKYLPLNSKMIDYLCTFWWLKQSLWYRSNYIFSPLRNNSTSDQSKAISWSYIFSLVKKETKKLQITGAIDFEKNITPHSFRTTFVKLALEKGMTDIEIMNTTWHSTSQMVKYYDARSQLDVNAAGVVDELFGE